jgi:hypothetical protein
LVRVATTTSRFLPTPAVNDKDAIIRISLSHCDEVPSQWSDSGKLDPISFGWITRHSYIAPAPSAAHMPGADGFLLVNAVHGNQMSERLEFDIPNIAPVELLQSRTRRLTAIGDAV